MAPIAIAGAAAATTQMLFRHALLPPGHSTRTTAMTKREGCKVIVIVDAFSTGALLPAEFKRRGVACIHVASRPVFPEFFRRSMPSADLFVRHLTYRNNFPDLVERLR